MLRRRQCLVPTARGWLILALTLIVVGILAARSVYPFLALSAPVTEGALIVEGWVTDNTMQAVKQEFDTGHYTKVYVVGGPIDTGAPLSEYGTYAERGAAVLVKLGLSTNAVQAVPAPEVRQDRTYTSAVSLAKWLRDHRETPSAFHLLGEGPHTRRSWLMCQKGLGDEARVGVTSVPVRTFDPQHWWRYSAGVRSVIDEFVAYLYARLVFRPPRES
jgi:hypothetical protein